MTTHLIHTADKALQATPGVSQATGRANPALSHSATNNLKSKTKASPTSIHTDHPKGSAKSSLNAQAPSLDPTRPANPTQQIPAFSPLYQQIKALILQSLRAGEWRPGEPIPSESDLAARYQVSQGTVRKAIDELSMENLLIRKQGIGTFVATHHEEQVQYRFLKLVPNERVHLSKPNVPPTRHILWCKSAKTWDWPKARQWSIFDEFCHLTPRRPSWRTCSCHITPFKASTPMSSGSIRDRLTRFLKPVLESEWFERKRKFAQSAQAPKTPSCFKSQLERRC